MEEELAMSHSTLSALIISLLALLGLVGCASMDPSPTVDTAAIASHPVIDFTGVPAYGSWTGLLTGRAYGVTFADYKAAIVIRVAGNWWTKPSEAHQYTSLGTNGQFSCDIATDGNDNQATEIAGFLLPKTASVPVLLGATDIPAAYASASAARVFWERAADYSRRYLTFSGRRWWIKHSMAEPVGPGPNYFSNSGRNIWLDNTGKLHLAIRPLAGRWVCSEAVCTDSLGYGRYTWVIDSRVDNLALPAVLGLFTWSDAPEYTHREIDIECSRWNDPGLPTNAQFVVQPWQDARERFVMPAVRPSTHSFKWSPGAVSFRSVRGPRLWPSDPGWVVHTWDTTTHVPVPGGENPRINLWLYEAAPPPAAQTVEVVVRSFSHGP